MQIPNSRDETAYSRGASEIASDYSRVNGKLDVARDQTRTGPARTGPRHTGRISSENLSVDA